MGYIVMGYIVMGYIVMGYIVVANVVSPRLQGDLDAVRIEAADFVQEQEAKVQVERNLKEFERRALPREFLERHLPRR